jgi:two-component system, OmpR family, phosphate regulon sensor histidine kinase PhoR
MKHPRWFLHPILFLVFSIIALGSSLFLYIYWYIEVSEGLKAVATKFNFDATQVLEPQNWVVILVLSILFGIILLGISIIFIFFHKSIQLYRLQRNFINNFTHELKTPVTSLKLYLETFCKYDISREKRLKYLDYMITDVNRLTNTINRILNLARIESKSFGGEFVRSNLVEFVEQFYKNNAHLFQNCKVRFHNTSGQSFYYRINLPLFEMLLMNLLTNAVKYNHADVPSIEVTFERLKKFLCIRFKDNGMGIEKAHIKKILKKFYQVGQSDDMSAKGSGLGLYLVEHIARIHQGKITAYSEGLNKGATFTLLLPVHNKKYV